MIGPGAFKLTAPYQPTGDQPQAIEQLVKGLKAGDKEQTLLGVTGSGKTFTMANVIAQVNRPTLVLATTKPWRPSCVRNSVPFSPKTPWNILSRTTIITSRKRISPRPIRILKRIPPSTTKSTNCAIPPRRPLSERRDVIIVASVSVYLQPR